MFLHSLDFLIQLQGYLLELAQLGSALLYRLSFRVELLRRPIDLLFAFPPKVIHDL